MAVGTCKFLIAGTQRTGTTLLRTSLNSHPDITCRGEVFKLGRSPYALPDGYWAYCRSGLWQRARSILAPRASVNEFLTEVYSQPGRAAIGLKLMLSHCRARPYLWDLIARHHPKVIHMVRRNHLKTLVSRRAAAASGVYHVSKSLPVKTAVASWTMKPVTLDAYSLLSDLDAIASESEEWRGMLARTDHVEVVYEEYARDPQSTNIQMVQFLGVREQKLNSDLKKVTSDSLPDAIANFSEVEALIGTSRYAYCLESGS